MQEVCAEAVQKRSNIFAIWRKKRNFVLTMEETKAYKNIIDHVIRVEKKYRDPDFSACKLAERLGIRSYTLSRIIKSEFGVTYTDIVHTLRVHDAMRHLKDKRFSPYTVDDIGVMVGFCNRQSFFSAFKKATGMTPEKYRLT